MVALKLLVLILGVLLISSLSLTIYQGRRRAISKHQRSANYFFWLMVLAILIIESIVRIRGGVTVDPLFIIHLCCSISFFIGLTVLRFYLTGLRSPSYHKYLAYGLLPLFLISASTGTWLLLFRI
jgi:hypothetical protein